MQKILARTFSTVNLVLEGGGAKGALYCGVLKQIQSQQLQIQTVTGASAGSLGCTFAGLNVPSDDLEKYLDPNQKNPEGLVDSIEIQDRISKDERLCLLNSYESRLYPWRDLSNWAINFILWKILRNEFTSIQDGLGSKDIIEELVVNGSYIAGYGLVRVIESFLLKYLPDSVKGEEARKNITLEDFQKVTGKNVVIMGSDITSKIPRIFSATTTPKLPLKYAVRISSSIPFYFPPIYWQEDWGAYLG